MNSLWWGFHYVPLNSLPNRDASTPRPASSPGDFQWLWLNTQGYPSWSSGCHFVQSTLFNSEMGPQLKSDNVNNPRTLYKKETFFTCGFGVMMDIKSRIVAAPWLLWEENLLRMKLTFESINPSWEMKGLGSYDIIWAPISNCAESWP